MAIVNKIDVKAESIENCANFVSNFSQRINYHTSKFDKVKVILTGTMWILLQEITNTIRNCRLETKCFLDSLKTKKELTNYFANKLASNLVKNVMIVFERTSLENLPDLNENLKIQG